MGEKYEVLTDPKYCVYCGILLDSVTCGNEGNLEERICDECKRRMDMGWR